MIAYLIKTFLIIPNSASIVNIFPSENGFYVITKNYLMEIDDNMQVKKLWGKEEGFPKNIKFSFKNNSNFLLINDKYIYIYNIYSNFLFHVTNPFKFDSIGIDKDGFILSGKKYIKITSNGMIQKPDTTVKLVAINSKPSLKITLRGPLSGTPLKPRLYAYNSLKNRAIYIYPDSGMFVVNAYTGNVIRHYPEFFKNSMLVSGPRIKSKTMFIEFNKDFTFGKIKNIDDSYILYDNGIVLKNQEAGYTIDKKTNINIKERPVYVSFASDTLYILYKNYMEKYFNGTKQTLNFSFFKLWTYKNRIIAYRNKKLYILDSTPSLFTKIPGFFKNPNSITVLNNHFYIIKNNILMNEEMTPLLWLNSNLSGITSDSSFIYLLTEDFLLKLQPLQ